MKKLFFLFSFILSTFSVFGQTAENHAVLISNSVEDIYLTKDDGKGKIGEMSENFATTDVPIHCVVLLNTEVAATVKMIFVAVSVKGVKPESKVVSVSYKTDGTQNQVNFTGKPEGVWTAGTYRVDIYLDGKSAGNRVFEIEPSLVKTEKTEKSAPSVIKTFAAPKTSPKPKPIRRAAKN